MEEYTVFVGGTEVNDHYLTWDCAVKVRRRYIEDGYIDVAIVNINTGESYGV